MPRMTADCRKSPNYWASRQIPSPGNADAIRRAFAKLPNAAMLESVAADSPSSCWSYYVSAPSVTISADPDTDGPDWLNALRVPGFPNVATACAEPPFRGGWIGYLSYEAGRWIEPKAGGRHDLSAFKLSQWRFYDTLLAHDVVTDRWFVAGVSAHPNSASRGTLDERLSHLAAFVRSIPLLRRSPDPAFSIPSSGEWNLTDDEYLQRVSRILDYIHAGDVYQVNMTRRFRAALNADPVDLYELLCGSNPASYAAFIRFDGDVPLRTIQSSSPELFLALEDSIVTTRPIKGTRPRSGGAQRDAEAIAELENSEKERAELNMIIDLERNDLGRVCEYGSIRVEHPGEIESHPTVFHRTATIRGRLRKECDAIDLIRATFPGGSITGAPKVRAMQIIDELETESRGPYCGAIGYIGVNGDMQLNLPIRTLTTIGERVELAVGSGVVADSNPREELEELNAKAAGMMRAIASCRHDATFLDQTARAEAPSSFATCSDATTSRH
ncbi:MAG: aminodeoxychorismate synthase component I [Phycisphaerales bacterium]|nr:aminodeoxychorismate synthase component I [Phycisphaerales bacterium]MCB9854321.1 aminodeoxychorismate synthase component I [Phycisphaerales bacterium]MCB9863522.1 aminodeoxychorismate synthase component I [Phycisphaerales bacterium]